jgi:hypothetical protein
VIFGWKKLERKGGAADREASDRLHVFAEAKEHGLIRFENVSLPPTIQDLSLEIPLGSWVILYGDDDFAKALFCDLCFTYIKPESGRVHPCLKGSDVSFIGRSNTTYGRTLIDHLSCGVKDNSRELMEFTVNKVLSKRLHRHLNPKMRLEFANGKRAYELELDERDFLEIAEANLLLQRRKAAVIDTTSDFYQIALEQGFRHSLVFLSAGKTLIWLIDDKHPLPKKADYWNDARFTHIHKTSLSFPSGSRAGYIN